MGLIGEGDEDERKAVAGVESRTEGGDTQDFKP